MRFTSHLQFPHDIPLEKTQKNIDEIMTLAKKLQKKPISHFQQQNIFHHQVLKSSLFSARIEGNLLTLAQSKEIHLENSQEKSRIEISNVLQALQKIQKLPQKFSKKTLLILHKQIMKKIDHRAGKFRQESSGIFDGLGNIVYLTPEPENMQKMLDILLEKVNETVEGKKNIIHHQLITTAQCHYYFEKIHPFIDGNGRVGRVLLQYQLQKTQLFADYILPIDEFFEKNRSDYYHHLEKNTRNIESFILFFLEGVVFALRELLEDIERITSRADEIPEKPGISNAFSQPKTKNSLLPRRQELVNIIQDHPYISLDGLSRRFPTIPRRTISYDVNWLVKNGLVVKYGETRGVRYGIA